MFFSDSARHLTEKHNTNVLRQIPSWITEKHNTNVLWQIPSWITEKHNTNVLRQIPSWITEKHNTSARDLSQDICFMFFSDSARYIVSVSGHLYMYYVFQWFS
jgi:ribosomal protein L39E